jgi:hypothetical protein
MYVHIYIYTYKVTRTVVLLFHKRQQIKFISKRVSTITMIIIMMMDLKIQKTIMMMKIVITGI